MFTARTYPRLSLQLGFNSKLPRDRMVEIHHMYGDHLYEKGDFDGAIAQYVHTIGFLNSSVVIAKFLGAHHVQQLMAFLEALHERQHEPGAGRFVVKPLHTTLLLNCYEKLMDVEKLERFLLQGNTTARAAHGGGGGGDAGGGAGGSDGSDATTARFDAVNAIQVLRSSYPELALELARREQLHDWYFRIRLEERQLAGIGASASSDHATSAQYAAGGFGGMNVSGGMALQAASIEEEALEDAMAYLLGLPFDIVVTQLQRWGKTLVEYLPDEMTDLLSALCTGCYDPLPELSEDGCAVSGDGDDDAAAAAVRSDEPQKCAPELFVHLLVNHPRHLRRFLENIVAAAAEEKRQTSATVGNTLLELLLLESEWGPTPGGENGEAERERCVMSLLRSTSAAYDADHALVLVQMHGFKAGELYLYEEKLRRYDMVVQVSVET